MAEEAVQIDSSTVSSRTSENELIRNAVSGNHLAFRDLYDNNVGRVYALCIRMTSNVDDAQELAQEVFIKAWRHLKEFKFESKFSTWLHRIAVNEFLSRKRSEKRNAEKISRAAEEWEMTMKAAYSFGSGREISIDLEKAVSKLPEQQRIAFMLYDVEGYQHNEIAGMMNISEGTSKSNLHRARKLLRELLREERKKEI